MEAVLFDMDGVLVDSEPHWKRIEAGFLRSIVPSFSSAVQDAVLGLSMQDAHRALREKFGLEKTFDEFQGYYRRFGAEVYREMAEPIAGGKELLSALAAENVPLALVSCSPRDWIQIVVQRFDLQRYFKLIISAEELHVPGKPSPYIYSLAVQRLGVKPSRSAAVEDSAVGVASAKAAGLCCVALCVQEGEGPAEADLAVRSLELLSPSVLRSLVRARCATLPDAA